MEHFSVKENGNASQRASPSKFGLFLVAATGWLFYINDLLY